MSRREYSDEDRRLVRKSSRRWNALPDSWKQWLMARGRSGDDRKATTGSCTPLRCGRNDTPLEYENPTATAELVQSPSTPGMARLSLGLRSERSHRLAQAVGAQRLDVVAAIEGRYIRNRAPAEAAARLARAMSTRASRASTAGRTGRGRCGRCRECAAPSTSWQRCRRP